MSSPGSSRSSGVDWVLIHGWGHSASVWQPFVDQLGPACRIQLVDLPGYGASCPGTGENDWKLSVLLPSLAESLPDNAICCGWSLGGMIATALAAEYPERIKALVTICSNPVFVQREDWRQAMPVETFDQFQVALERSPQETRRRFQALAVSGGEHERENLRTLKQVAGVQDGVLESALIDSLKLLKQLDVRVQVKNLEIPQLHILGGRDALVPNAVAADLLALNSDAQVEQIETSAHVPLISHCRELAGLVAKVTGI